MEKQFLDLKVHVEDDHVYMSAEDWLKIVKVLGNTPYRCSVSEEKQGVPDVLIRNKPH